MLPIPVSAADNSWKTPLENMAGPPPPNGRRGCAGQAVQPWHAALYTQNHELKHFIPLLWRKQE